MLDLRDVEAQPLLKRCDAKQPCSTCVNKDRGATCIYGQPCSSRNVAAKRSMFPPTDALPARSDSREPGHPHPPSLGFREGSLAPPEQFERRPPPLMLETVVPVPLSDASAIEKTLHIVERPWYPTFAILSSVHFGTIPRPLRGPSSLVPPEYMQVSWVSGSDLDMTLYVFFLRLRKCSSYWRD